MKAKAYKRMLAVVLSAGMMAVQPASVMAADTGMNDPLQQEQEGGEGQDGAQSEDTEQPNDTEQPEEARQAAAVDGSGTMVDISEEVLKMLEDGTVYQDEETKFLHDSKTNQKVDPVTGERVEEKPEEKPGGDGSDRPGDNTPDKPGDNTPDKPGDNTTDKPGGNTTDKPGSDDEDGKDDGDKEENGGTSDNGNTGGSQDGSDQESGDTQKPSDSGESGSDGENEGNNSGDAQEAPAAQDHSNNQALIAGQQIFKLPEIKKDFRFWTVARRYAFAKAKLSVREEMTENARAVGSLNTNGLLYVLQEEEDGWLYVESGTVRGFVKADEVLRGDDAQKLLTKYQDRAKKKAERTKTKYTGIESVVSVAKELIPQNENNAFLHTHSTVNRTVIDKKYALTTIGLLNVREGKDTNTRIVGTLKADSLCYVLADENEEWVYIESGDVRGFVNKKYLKTGNEVNKTVEEKGEENFPTASEIIEPEKNKACYYTLTSVKSGVPGSSVRQSVLEFASQFIGNPYVWGGTSLTEGADCSGFVQSIFKEYGYNLPRVAEDQAQYGTKIAVEDAQPGDLIFYAKDGYIHHVVIYAGDGKTVEAMGSDYGIVQGNVDTSEAVWAVKVLDDSVGGGFASSIGEVNATDDMYGEYLGDYQLTYYCSCEVCCDVETGITATGTPVVEGQTIAVDPSVIPYGTQVIIGGHVFTAEDCGGAVKGNHIDIYVNDHDRALSMGVNQADVYLVK